MVKGSRGVVMGVQRGGQGDLEGWSRDPEGWSWGSRGVVRGI